MTEATKKQATEATQKFLNVADEVSVGKKNEKSQLMIELQNEIEPAKKSLHYSELEKAKADLKAMKNQTKATKREYNRLLNELHPVMNEISKKI